MTVWRKLSLNKLNWRVGVTPVGWSFLSTGKARAVCLLFFLVFMVYSPQARAQSENTVDLEKYVERLNSQCPLDHGDEWGINSFTLVGSYALVDVMVPSNLAMFMPSLTGDSDNVKRVWIKQLATFGNRWKRFAEKMVDIERSIVINLRPKGSKQTYLITLLPTDFNQK